MIPPDHSFQSASLWPWARAVLEAGLAAAVAWLLWRRRRPSARKSAAGAAGARAQDGYWAAALHAGGGDGSDGFAHVAIGTAWQWDAKDDVLLVPDAFLALVGVARAQKSFTGAWLQDLILPADRRKVRRRVRDCLAGRTADCAFECRLRGAEGRTLYLQVQGMPHRDRKGRVLSLVGSFIDLTRQVEVAEERDRLFNLSRDLLAIGDFAGYLKQVNPSWVRILGWSRDELMANPLRDFVHPEDRERATAELAKLTAGQPTDEFQMRFRCRNGSYRWLSWSSYPYPGRKLVFSAVRDITAQKEAQEQLLDYQGRLRSLSEQLARVEDAQRRELAAAIHDGLAQQLFGIRAQVSLLAHPGLAGRTTERVPEILALLDDTMQEARSLSFTLVPPVLSEAGLEAALEWLARSFSKRTGIACAVDGPQEEDSLPQEMRAMVFQCVRELLNNVHKHAGARAASIALAWSPQELRVTVADDGTGFAPQEGPTRGEGGLEGFGLFSIRERVRAAGGAFALQSSPGGGCAATLTLPLAPTSAEDASASERT